MEDTQHESCHYRNACSTLCSGNPIGNVSASTEENAYGVPERRFGGDRRLCPYASRFTNGAYIHGVPVNAPRTSMIEYSWSLGTTPRSHMCVRNATSHSKFVFDWAPTERSLVVVIE